MNGCDSAQYKISIHTDTPLPNNILLILSLVWLTGAHGYFTTLLKAIHSERVCTKKRRRFVVKFRGICEHRSIFMHASGFTLKNLYYGLALRLGVSLSVSRGNIQVNVVYFFPQFLFFFCSC